MDFVTISSKHVIRRRVMDGPQISSSQTGGVNDDPAQKAQEEQMRRDLLATVLDTGARERRKCVLSCITTNFSITLSISIENSVGGS